MNAPATAAELKPGTFEYIDLGKIVVSNTQMQQDRRASLDKEALKKLTENVAQVGVIQPILVRPIAAGKYELVAGERRFIAATGAKLKTIPAVMRELSDKQVAELQVVENIQRENLHELIEAEGYEELVEKHGYTKEEIAAKIGKSKEYVYGRLKLCELSPKGRKALLANTIPASIALLLARIPVHELQDEALQEIIENEGDSYNDGQPMSFRQAKEFIQDNFMLRLDQAPFKTGDAELVPKAGPCTLCPKRTGNQPELFGDVKSKDTCTDPKCFAIKKEAHFAATIKEHEKAGRKIIKGAEAKKLLPHSHSTVANGFVALDESEWFGNDRKTWRSVLGKAAPEATLLINPHRDDGKIVEIVRRDQAVAALKEKGIVIGYGSSRSSSSNGSDREREKKARLETNYNQMIFDAIREKPLKLGIDELRMITVATWDRLHYDAQKPIMALYGWPDRGGGESTKQIDKMDEGQLARLLLDCTLAPEIKVNTYHSGKPDNANLEAVAKKLGINTAAFKKKLLDEKKEKDQKKKVAAQRKKEKETKEKKAAKKPAAAAPAAKTEKKKKSAKTAKTPKPATSEPKPVQAPAAWPFPIHRKDTTVQ